MPTQWSTFASRVFVCCSKSWTLSLEAHSETGGGGGGALAGGCSPGGWLAAGCWLQDPQVAAPLVMDGIEELKPAQLVASDVPPASGLVWGAVKASCCKDPPHRQTGAINSLVGNHLTLILSRIGAQNCQALLLKLCSSELKARLSTLSHPSPARHSEQYTLPPFAEVQLAKIQAASIPSQRPGLIPL